MKLMQTLKDNLENMLIKNIEELNACDDIKPDRKIFALHSAISSLETLRGETKVEMAEKIKQNEQTQISFPETKKSIEKAEQKQIKISKLATERKKKRMSQKELAFCVGCSQKTISNIETGKKRPSYDLAKNICKALGYTKTAYKLFPTSENTGMKRGENKHFTTNLRHLRLFNNLTQAELEQLAGLDVRCVGLMESGLVTGEKPSTRVYLKKLANVFDWQGDPLTLLDEYEGDE